MKKYLIIGLAQDCPLCLEPVDGRVKSTGRTFFQVAAEGGGYAGPCCAAHLSAMMRMEEKGVNIQANTQPVNTPKPAQPVTNGPAVAAK